MMLSISNIAWEAGDDEAVYALMRQYGYTGLEIAPTRIFRENPYCRTEEARLWAARLQEQYGFVIPSMQSIWYGRQERLFGTAEERAALLAYTKQAADFAVAVGCRNLVFGCPRNRYLPEGADTGTAAAFFKELGDYAAAHGTVIGMEANPPIYHTNYINTTAQALELIRTVDSPGFRLNLDVGTMIENGEPASVLAGAVGLISHVHISEPGLKPVRRRKLHHDLRAILEKENYRGFVSVEMGKADDISRIKDAAKYVKEIFGC